MTKGSFLAFVDDDQLPGMSTFQPDLSDDTFWSTEAIAIAVGVPILLILIFLIITISVCIMK